jgi:hypothetical protein
MDGKTPTPEDIKKETELIKAQTDLMKAKADDIAAQRALAKAQQEPDTKLDDLKKQKDLADAKKDLANSQTDALKAQVFGTVTGGSFSGAVDMKDKAGAAEANLLASQAIRFAAARISAKVNELTGGKPIYLFNVKDFPNFQRLAAFRFRKELVRQAYQSAQVISGGEESVAPAPALVSGALDALSKLLGFFKSDFTVGGTEVKADDTQLLFAVAGRLANHEVYLPAVYDPAAQDGAVSSIAAALAELAQPRINADKEIKALSDQLAELLKAGDEKKTQADTVKSRVELLKSIVVLHDAFLSSLSTSDSNGILPIALLTQEMAADAHLQKDGAVLLVKLENAAGGYFVKKNLLTGLGFMPLYHMGGAVASYVLLSGNQGKVLASDVVPVHGGFVKAGDVQAELAKNQDTTLNSRFAPKNSLVFSGSKQQEKDDGDQR